VYFSLIRSQVKYGAVIWDQHLAKDIQLAEAVQWKAARFVFNNYKHTASVSGMINKLGWESLESRREKRLTQTNEQDSWRHH